LRNPKPNFWETGLRMCPKNNKRKAKFI